MKTHAVTQFWAFCTGRLLGKGLTCGTNLLDLTIQQEQQGHFLLRHAQNLQFLLKFACKTKENVINPSRCSPLVLYLTSRRITPTYTVLAYVRGEYWGKFQLSRKVNKGER